MHDVTATAWHVVGDSHVAPFRRASELGLIRRDCRFTAVGGATAVGLRNPNALTDAVGIFKAALLPASSSCIPVIQLGEVDCGFVIWHRARRNGEDVARQLEASVAAHLGFVDALVSGGYPSVVLTGATLPTIRDGHAWGEVANLRREVTASQAARTALTLDYNAMLREAAKERGLPYVDISDRILDRGSGVVDRAFCHPDPEDHHLHPERAAALWADGLNRLGELLASGSVIRREDA